MRSIIAIAILFVWTSCYLNCSTGLFGMVDVEASPCSSTCAESGESDSAPGYPPTPEPCDDDCDVFAVEQLKPFSADPPVADEEPNLDYLFANAASDDAFAGLSFAPSPDSRYETDSALNWRFYANAARPIRGPSV